MGNGSSGMEQAHMNELIWNTNAYHFEVQAYFCRCVPNNDFFAWDALKMAIAKPEPRSPGHPPDWHCTLPHPQAPQSQKILWETLIAPSIVNLLLDQTKIMAAVFPNNHIYLMPVTDVRSVYWEVLCNKCCFWTLFCGIQLVMNNLQSILENVDTPDLLCQSVKCILQVARCYPHVFSTNFRVRDLAVIGPLAILSRACPS